MQQATSSGEHIALSTAAAVVYHQLIGTNAGSADDSSETARPWITLVPWPETEALATERTGRKFEPV